MDFHSEWQLGPARFPHAIHESAGVYSITNCRQVQKKL
jgi:hypothetical protein